jgi:hypothetical protein
VQIEAFAVLREYAEIDTAVNKVDKLTMRAANKQRRNIHKSKSRHLPSQKVKDNLF